MKKSVYYILLIMVTLFLLGCHKKNSDNPDGVIKDYTEEGQGTTVTDAPTIAPTATEVPENHEGEMRSYLSGQWVPVEVGTKRPIAFQFNNFKTVSNQWAIGQADIVYEALVEGGITRLLGIGENFSGDRIGSTRSARHYFVSLADEYDAIYVHYGKTKYATAKMDKLGIDHMDGSTGIGNVVYYRDNSIKAPHNAFASLKGILDGIKQKGFRTEYKEGYEPHYLFYEADMELSGGSALNKISLKYSSYNSPFFEYNTTDKLYYRSQFGAPHKDSLTGNQLAFKNIIIQFVKEWNIDKKGYQTMDLENASGDGYYITNGKLIPITWKKKEAQRWMRYYNEAGEELTINPGKTFISLFPNNRTKDVVLE
jgi:hypothetical protein